MLQRHVWHPAAMTKRASCSQMSRVLKSIAAACVPVELEVCHVMRGPPRTAVIRSYGTAYMMFTDVKGLGNQLPLLVFLRSVR